MAKGTISELFKGSEQEILGQWLKAQTSADTYRPDLMKESELRAQSSEFLRLFQAAVAGGNTQAITASSWEPVREFLGSISRTRGQQGFSPSETASFVLSLKLPLFAKVRELAGNDASALADQLWGLTEVLDRLALYTTEVHQKGREEVILRQQRDMMELSTPVVTVWDGVLALPLIGTLDSGRTQTVMEALLQRIVETGSEIAIIDITGVPTVDTLTAQHLIKTITATRLMGADCIISGIRPQIAQTIVHLGVDLGDVTTKASLASALQLALQRIGYRVQKHGKPAPKTLAEGPGQAGQ
ncbi:MAG: STAS domain-containing protein [Myxococcaceae bacterium]